jgi:hypothetical protein
LAELIVIPFDDAAAAELDKLSNSRKLKKIGRADLLIASIVLANDATLVTRNVKHFRLVPNLKLKTGWTSQKPRREKRPWHRYANDVTRCIWATEIISSAIGVGLR